MPMMPFRDPGLASATSRTSNWSPSLFTKFPMTSAAGRSPILMTRLAFSRVFWFVPRVLVRAQFLQKFKGEILADLETLLRVVGFQGIFKEYVTICRDEKTRFSPSSVMK